MTRAEIVMIGARPLLSQRTTASLHNPHHHTVNHPETCVAESEEEIVALFDPRGWAFSLVPCLW